MRLVTVCDSVWSLCVTGVTCHCGCQGASDIDHYLQCSISFSRLFLGCTYCVPFIMTVTCMLDRVVFVHYTVTKLITRATMCGRLSSTV